MTNCNQSLSSPKSPKGTEQEGQHSAEKGNVIHQMLTTVITLKFHHHGGVGIKEKMLGCFLFNGRIIVPIHQCHNPFSETSKDIINGEGRGKPQHTCQKSYNPQETFTPRLEFIGILFTAQHR